ncbi:hypothetical protein AB0B27_13935 [Micromonospora rifamycinica]|uniref:hypothetical protein n=1 Tax=Micromonospora rifamycinica TaxID=291594 RepID=UPI0033F93280
MTSAPACLLAARRVLLDYLGPGARTRPGVTILDPLGDPAWEIGIVGDTGHIGGYHTGSDRIRRVDGAIRDYSVTESPRDRAGLTLDASALDVGRFRVRTPLGTFDLPHYSRWLVAQCKANTADTRHLREVIYSPDGRTVRRWDRLGKRSTGDDSHLGHTHESSFRDATKDGADMAAVKRRYLTEIGVITPPEVPDMTPEEHDWLKTIHRNSTVLDGRQPIGQTYLRLAEGRDHTPGAKPVSHPTLTSLSGQLATLHTAQVALLGAVQGVDTKEILARIDAHAAAEKQRDEVAAKERAELAARLAALQDLVARWQSGELTADQVVDEMARRLAGDSIQGQARE